MKTLCTAAVILLALASPSAASEEALGRVRGVYAEAARGVLMDSKLGRTSPSAIRWADVELTSGPEGRRRVLVQVPAEISPVAGDLVAVRLEDALPARIAGHSVPVLRVSRVTEVRSRAFAGIGNSPSAGASSSIVPR